MGTVGRGGRGLRGARAALRGMGRLVVCCSLAVAAQAAGGERAQPAAAVRVELSPDARWAAVECAGRGRDAGEVWVLDLDSGGARQVQGTRLRLAQEAWELGGLLGVVALDAARRPAETRWLEPESGELVTTQGPKDSPEDAGIQLPERVWGRVVADRRGTQRVEWTARGLDAELPEGAGDVQLALEPGVAFFSQRHGEELQILRLDIARATLQPVCPQASGALDWKVSPDGAALIAVDSQRTRVWSLADGRVLGGPWAPGAANWVEHDGSRHLVLEAAGRRTLVDLAADRELDLGPARGSLELTLLPDGRLLVLCDGRVELRDADGAAARTLYPQDS